MSITIEFTPWEPFQALKDASTIQSWLEQVAKASEAAFRSGASRAWPGGNARGSAPGEWPMRRSGGMLGSIQTEVTSDSMTIGSNMPYSTYLAFGTHKMGGPRKMSKEALQAGMQGSQLGHWVEWSRS